MDQSLIFYQLYEAETSTYTYLLADLKTKEAVIIDPVLEMVDRDLQLLKELDLNLKYVLDTHIHADHITGAGALRERTGAKTGVSAAAQVPCADLQLQHGQTINFGGFNIKVLSTPGHTDSCLCFQLGSHIFTGDSLMIRSAGRTDFQQGSSEKLFQSVHQYVYSLPDETKIWPAHDYRGQTHSTVGLEKQFNPRLGLNVDLSEFKKIMSELNLAHPKKINEAVPANLKCGMTK